MLDNFNFDRLAKQALTVIGETVEKQAKSNMDKVSHGRTYIIGGKRHIASKAGDSPNNLSGALRKSIRFEVNGKIMEFGAGGGDVNYAKYLETGTPKMKERPNYVKSIMENKAEIDREVTNLFIKALR